MVHAGVGKIWDFQRADGVDLALGQEPDRCEERALDRATAVAIGPDALGSLSRVGMRLGDEEQQCRTDFWG